LLNTRCEEGSGAIVHCPLLNVPFLSIVMSVPSIVERAQPHIRALHAYVPGLQPQEPGWIKLNTNENAYPPSPCVVEAIRREIGTDGASLRLYPNPTSAPLRAAVAARHGLAPENVCIGNGGDDVLNLLVRCFCGAEVAGAWTVPSYSLYPVLIGLEGAPVQAVEFAPDMRLPVEAIIRSEAPICFLTTPNAPTGVGFAADDLRAVVRGFRGLLVADETYAPFADSSIDGWVREFPNLCVTRSFSKSHCLAGQRIGYALAHPEVIGLLDRVRDSYNVSRLGQVAALAALGDTEYYDGLVRRIRETRERFRDELTRRLGWFVYPSQTNFVFAAPRDAAGRTGPEVVRSFYDHLCANKILVRLFPSHPLTRDFARISIGTDEEMNVLLKTIDSWLRNAPPPSSAAPAKPTSS
jgi:histidinol-phosphate aminotransferase